MRLARIDTPSVVAFALLLGCTPSPKTAKPAEQALVFSVAEMAGSELSDSGPIPGRGSSNVPQIRSASEVADRLVRCGVSRFTIDYSYTHVEYVIVESTPKNLEIVKCVQAKLNFGFGAAVGPADDPALANSAPFRTLHAHRS